MIAPVDCKTLSTTSADWRRSSDQRVHWYQARNDDYVSPVVRGMNRYKPADHKGKRILSDKEIRALWVCTAEMGTYGVLVRLLLLTAQRCAKVAAMQWDELADGVWTIPTERREKGNAERLRLPQLALDTIGKQARLSGNPFVFGVAGGKGHFNSFSQRKEELDKKLKQMLPDMPALGLGSRVTPVHTAMRNCTRDEGRPFEFGNQVLISSHRKLLWSKATVVNVAEEFGTRFRQV
ncbi:MAG: hypothetical protein ACXWVE_06380 [Rhodoplanes sp.]